MTRDEYYAGKEFDTLDAILHIRKSHPQTTLAEIKSLSKSDLLALGEICFRYQMEHEHDGD